MAIRRFIADRRIAVATDAECMTLAIAKTEAELDEGGIPIVSVLAGPQGLLDAQRSVAQDC